MGGSPSSLDLLYIIYVYFLGGSPRGESLKYQPVAVGRADDGKRSELSSAEERSLSFNLATPEGVLI